MTSQEIQDAIVTWAQSKNFSAPYGILTGSHVNKKGRKYLSVTFGRARSLDATVDIYNKSFMILRTSRNFNEVFKSFEDLQQALDTL